MLRVALVTPLVFGGAVAVGAALPFVAALLFATLALKMPAPPPLRGVIPLALLLVVLPLGFAGVAGALIQFPYLLVGFVGLVLFHAFRLQSAPRTAPIGVLLQTFVILLPIVTGQSQAAGGIFAGAFAVNGALAVAGIYVAFALFPGSGPAGLARAAAPVTDAAESTRSAAAAALVMLPPFALMLAFDLGSAVRVLFTIAIVLTSLSQRDAHETGMESVLSAILAGATAMVLSVLHVLWPQPLGLLLNAALIGLIVVPHALSGPIRGPVALAVPLVWLLLGTAADETLVRTLTWCLYSVIGVFYTVWARALILAFPAWLRRLARPPRASAG